MLPSNFHKFWIIFTWWALCGENRWFFAENWKLCRPLWLSNCRLCCSFSCPVIEIIHFDFFLHLFKVIRSELPSSLNLVGRYKSVSHATLNKEFALTKRWQIRQINQPSLTRTICPLLRYKSSLGVVLLRLKLLSFSWETCSQLYFLHLTRNYDLRKVYILFWIWHLLICFWEVYVSLCMFIS